MCKTAWNPFDNSFTDEFAIHAWLCVCMDDVQHFITSLCKYIINLCSHMSNGRKTTLFLVSRMNYQNRIFSYFIIHSHTHIHSILRVCRAWTTYFKLMDCQLMMLAKYLTPHNHHVATIVCWERCKRGVSLIRATTIDYYGLVIMLMRCHDASQLDRDLQIIEDFHHHHNMI